MREFEDENGRLKRIVASQAIEIEAIKEVRKKSGDPATEARSYHELINSIKTIAAESMTHQAASLRRTHSSSRSTAVSGTSV